VAAESTRETETPLHVTYDAPVIVRPARDTDYATFVALFAELGVDDPVLDETRFRAEIVPTMLVAEDGAPVGYAYFQLTAPLAYVRNVVTAPSARRRGVGRALMGEVAERARAAGCATWCLNVLRDNAAAIALYEAVGLRVARESTALEVPRHAVASAATALVRPARADEDVAAFLGTVPEQLVLARARGRTPYVLEEGGAIAGAAVFDPRFPGAFPIRVARPELAPPLVGALAALVPDEERVHVTFEGDPAATAVLLALGAKVRFEMFHMRGALPAARAI